MLIIRPATSAQAHDLAEIGLAAWEKAVRGWGEDVSLLRENAKTAYYNYCTKSWPFILAAELDGELAGWASVEKSDDTITDLWVHPAFQNRGVGTGLLEAIEEQIKAHGYRLARVKTHARNIGAIRLYKRLGYHVASYDVAYNAQLDEDVDTVEIIKEFEPKKERPKTEPGIHLDKDGLYEL